MAHVQIVEPDPEVRDLIKLLVQRMGYKVRDADGIVAGEDDDPDVLVIEPMSDLGRAALSAMEASRPGRPMPRVCVSLYPREMCDAGCQAASQHLVKPFGSEELQRALEAALQRTASQPVN